MKKISLAIGLVLIVMAGFAQKEERNGVIYKQHPYIDVVNKAVKAYLSRDIAGGSAFYADTAKFWVSGMKKQMPMSEALKMFDTDFNYYDSIQLKVVGYPDYLHYDDQDAKVVQSWWTWIGKSKKTGEKVSISVVQFDNFNKDGKIEFEMLYGDFSKMVKD
jgi:hypothetical protein